MKSLKKWISEAPLPLLVIGMFCLMLSELWHQGAAATAYDHLIERWVTYGDRARTVSWVALILAVALWLAGLVHPAISQYLARKTRLKNLAHKTVQSLESGHRHFER